MPKDLDRKRARNLAYYHEQRAAGTWQRSKPQTPEAQAKAAARQQRHMQWREVQRAFDRVMRLPPDVFSEAIKRVNDKEAAA